MLIADDDPTLVRFLEAKCASLGLCVETASDGLRALLKVTKVKPDLLILDLNLPDVDGFKVVERLTDPKFPPLPVIVLTARSDEASIKHCEELGVLYFQKEGWEQLEKAIYNVFLRHSNDQADEKVSKQRSAKSAPRLLLVDDNLIVLKAITAALQKYCLEVIRATSGMQGFWLTLSQHPDVVVTDFNMEQGSGHYLLSRIKSTPSILHIPVVIFTGQSLEKGEQHALRRQLRGRGQAAAFISKPDTSALLEEIGRHVPVRSRV